jgi:hypothetical protein
LVPPTNDDHLILHAQAECEVICKLLRASNVKE